MAWKPYHFQWHIPVLPIYGSPAPPRGGGGGSGSYWFLPNTLILVSFLSSTLVSNRFSPVKRTERMLDLYIRQLNSRGFIVILCVFLFTFVLSALKEIVLETTCKKVLKLSQIYPSSQTYSWYTQKLTKLSMYLKDISNCNSFFQSSKSAFKSVV